MVGLYEQITEISMSDVNITLIIVLMIMGWVLKHFAVFVKNQYIPVILVVLGIIISILLKVPFNPQEELLNLVISGGVSGYIATMAHEKGKSIFDALGLSNETD